MLSTLSRIGKWVADKYITYQLALGIFVAGVIVGQAEIIFVVWLWVNAKPLPFVGGG